MKDEKRDIMQKMAGGEISVEEEQKLLDKIGSEIKSHDSWRIRYSRAVGAQEMERILGNVLPNENPEFLEELDAVGRGSVSYNELGELVAKHATNEYLSQIASLGYGDLNSRQLGLLIMNDVGPDFVRGLLDVGYEASPKHIVDTAIYDVTLDHIDKLMLLSHSHAGEY
ncbi:MAG: hypothetical protein EAX81_03830 [Candidatus Thorarchaeota archaeon]|nr:hypothetical protein [Candidatus Thorarchaeota archaeon]